MTYKELLDFLKSLEQNADNRLEDGVTVWDMEAGESDGIMDVGHLFFGFGL